MVLPNFFRYSLKDRDSFLLKIADLILGLDFGVLPHEEMKPQRWTPRFLFSFSVMTANQSSDIYPFRNYHENIPVSTHPPGKRWVLADGVVRTLNFSIVKEYWHP